MIASVLLVMIVELLNSAIEATVDRISLEHHHLAKRAKDIGSAAVLLSLVSLTPFPHHQRTPAVQFRKWASQITSRVNRASMSQNSSIGREWRKKTTVRTHVNAK